MHERRQAFRFRPTPDRLFATIRGKGGSSRAQLLDESATGLGLRVTGQWVPKVGDKIEVELSNDVVVAKVVRKECDGRENILGLLRLSEDPFTNPSDTSDGLSELLSAFRNHGHHLAFPALAAVALGAVIGLLVLWKPAPPLRRLTDAVPIGGAPLKVATSPPAPLKKFKNPAAPSPPAKPSPQAKTSIHKSAAKGDSDQSGRGAAPDGEPSATLSFDDVLAQLPGSVRSGYRDLAARSSSDLSATKRAEVDRVVRGVKRELRALEARAKAGEGGTVDGAAAAVLDRAGKQIDAIVAAPQ